jgi:acyl transferase domain-containing protein
MGRQLLKRERLFQLELERCGEAIRRQAGWSLLDELMAGESESRLSEVEVAQPSIFAIQVALAALWRSWGVEPDAVTGHSMGEIAAAHVAGALSLEDAARIICRRSRLLKTVSGRGGMAAIGLSIEQARQALSGYEDRLSIAVNGGPSSSVVSGDLAAIQEMTQALKRQGVYCQPVKVDVASHSPQMEPLRDDLLSLLSEIEPRPPSIPIYSTVTGERGDELIFDALYWMRNLRDPVLFSTATQRLAEDGHNIFLEIGPHPILSTPIQHILQHLGHNAITLPSLRQGEDDCAVMGGSLGALNTSGCSIHRRKLSPDAGQSAINDYDGEAL